MSGKAATRHGADIVLLGPRDEFVIDSPESLQLPRHQALDAELRPGTIPVRGDPSRQQTTRYLDHKALSSSSTAPKGSMRETASPCQLPSSR